MEGGGSLFMRKMVQMIALYIRLHPEIKDAMDEHKLLLKAAHAEHHNAKRNYTQACHCSFHGLGTCHSCNYFYELGWKCSACYTTNCNDRCLKHSTTCFLGCCRFCPNCLNTRFGKCSQAGCDLHLHYCPNQSSNMYRKCLNKPCQNLVCEEHARFCSWCGEVSCTQCYEKGHEGCKKLKKAKTAEGGE
jgi:hypothetical protein